MVLTPAGAACWRAVPIWERTHAELEGRLPDGDPDLLRSNLRALSAQVGVARAPRRRAV